jgi:haloalkane dehalogenase
MSYIDAGAGSPVVFVHGNPANAAAFEPVIGRLIDQRRCIAMDHIGFGRSDKPTDWDYLPASHADNVAALLDSLDLDDVTLVVGDWGGPIGLSWALRHPERVTKLVLTNTWCWPVNRSWYYQGFSRFVGGPIGRYLIRHHNFFARTVVSQAWGTRTPLTPELHALFTDVHPGRDERKGMWVFPKQIIGSTEWLDELWSQRRNLADLDMTLLWGMQDVAFRADVLETWLAEFPAATVSRLDDVGHFIELEAPDALVAAVLAESSS